MTNTVKRAILIWLSILIFHNPITFMSGLGMVLVSVGVLLYNQARHHSPTEPSDDNKTHTTSSQSDVTASNSLTEIGQTEKGDIG